MKRSSKSKKRGKLLGKNSLLENAKKPIYRDYTSEEAELIVIPSFAYSGSFESNSKIKAKMR